MRRCHAASVTYRLLTTESTRSTKEEKKGFLQVFFVAFVSFVVDSFLTRCKRGLLGFSGLSCLTWAALVL